jgi:hypothetical protein
MSEHSNDEIIAYLRIRNPQRPYAGLPLRSRGMKIWSTPHGDMGSHVNYNGEVSTWPLENPTVCWNIRVSGGTRPRHT